MLASFTRIFLFIFFSGFVTNAFALDNESIFEYAEKADITGIQKAIKNGADVNAVNKKNWSLLRLMSLRTETISQNKMIEIIKLLIDNGLDISSTKNDNGMVLHNLIYKEYSEVAIFLINNGIPFTQRGMLRRTPIMVSAFKGLDDVTQLLLDKIPQSHINSLDKRGETLLSHAIPKTSISIIDEIINKGANVNKPERTNNLTPLTKAVWQDTNDVVELLLQNGANPNVFTDQATTPLTIRLSPWHNQSDSEMLAIAKLLVAYGANVNTGAQQPDGSIDTPLSLATEKGFTMTASFLRSKGARMRYSN